MSFSPPTKNLKVSWKEVHRNTKALAETLKQKGPWDKIVAIARGGLIPAAIIAKELNIRIIDTVSIESYNNKKRSKLNILKRSTVISKGNILIVDDIIDTGQTLKTVKKIYPKAHYATVYAKPAGMPFVNSFVKKVSQNTWIVFPWESYTASQ